MTLDKNSNGAGCLFCKIAGGDIPAEKVYEDEKFLAFLDIHPVNIGHVLVIPKGHSTNLYDTPSDVLTELFPLTRRIAIAVKDVVKADGINIEMNNEAPAGQVIPHTHIHVIPRFIGDGFTHWHGARDYNEGEAKEIALEIQKLARRILVF